MKGKIRKLVMAVVVLVTVLAGCASLGSGSVTMFEAYSDLYTERIDEVESLEGIHTVTRMVLARTDIWQPGFTMVVVVKSSSGYRWFDLRYIGPDWFFFDFYRIQTDSGITDVVDPDPIRTVLSGEDGGRISERLTGAITPGMARELSNTTILAFQLGSAILRIEPEGIDALRAFLNG